MLILLSAFACRPNKGSEHGLGWGWATTLAEIGHEVVVLTRSRNRAAIERHLASEPRVRLSFQYVELPRWAERVIDRGEAGIRIYYSLWQWAAWWRARRLVRERRFDLIHHATFAKYWAFSPLAFLPVPFLLGPVGGGEDAPLAHWPQLGAYGMLFEAARAAARSLSELNPLLRWGLGRAVLVAACTEDTARRVRALGARRVAVVTQVALSDALLATLEAVEPRPAPPPWRLTMVGALVPLKAPHLVLKALSTIDDLPWRLEVYGDGPGRTRLQDLAREIGVDSRVTFHGAVGHDVLLTRLGDCHALVFAGLHDSGGMVCGEALAAGLEVVALRLGGPVQVVEPCGGILVDGPTPSTAIQNLAQALRRMMTSESDVFAERAAARRAAARHHLSWTTRARRIYGLLEDGA